MSNAEKGRIEEELGFEIGGPGRVYYDDVVLDNVVESLMEMSALLWTVRDRQIVLERILAEKGIDVSAAIEAHEPDEAESAARREERDAMVKQVFRSFLRRPSAGSAKDANAPSRRDLEDKQ
jgi:hypothetical protein